MSISSSSKISPIKRCKVCNNIIVSQSPRARFCNLHYRINRSMVKRRSYERRIKTVSNQTTGPSKKMRVYLHMMGLGDPDSMTYGEAEKASNKEARRIISNTASAKAKKLKKGQKKARPLEDTTGSVFGERLISRRLTDEEVSSNPEITILKAMMEYNNTHVRRDTSFQVSFKENPNYTLVQGYKLSGGGSIWLRNVCANTYCQQPAQPKCGFAPVFEEAGEDYDINDLSESLNEDDTKEPVLVLLCNKCYNAMCNDSLTPYYCS